MSEFDPLDYIFDAWALLAHFENEDGAVRVREILKSAEKGDCTAGISIINVGEIAYITERERGLTKVFQVLATIRSFPLVILPASEKVVFAASHIKANHRLSYADAFAAASSQLWNGKLLTGDPEFQALAGTLISVEWLPGK